MTRRPPEFTPIKSSAASDVYKRQHSLREAVDAGVDVEKEEHSSIVGGMAGLYNHSGNQSGSSSENCT